MRRRDKIVLIGIILVTAFAVSTLLWPAFGRAIDREEIKLGLDLEGGAHFVYQADFTELPDDQNTDDAKDEALEGVINVIEKRVNAYGVSEPVIQKVGDDRILIQLPGIEDIEEARELIGKTVLVNFKEFVPVDTGIRDGLPEVDTDIVPPVESGSPTPVSISGSPAGVGESTDVVPLTESGSPAELDEDATPALISDSGSPTAIEDIESPVELATSGTVSYFTQVVDEDGQLVLTEVDKSEAQWMAIPATGTIDGEKVELTSQYFKGKVEFGYQGAIKRPVITFDWDDVGSDLFFEITTDLSSKPTGSVERRLGIFVGDEYESAPNVNEPIRGSGVIEGMDKSEAKRLASLLNAGRIDVPLTTIEEHDVSATLGDEFVDRSIQAGIVGIILIILFLILYYRVPGTMAGIALLIYSAIVLATFQIVEVTLTLAGIAGFILSIGMAVDANVLIFERMKEEIRLGRTVRAAVETGFNRAWTAIRDSNISTLITCLILYFMGDSLGVPAVQGFALTLAIGVFISMLSAIIVTRTLLRIVGVTKLVDRNSLFIAATKGVMLSGEGR